MGRLTEEDLRLLAEEIFGRRGRLGHSAEVSNIACPPPGKGWVSSIATAPVRHPETSRDSEAPTGQPEEKTSQRASWKALGLTDEEQDLIETLAAEVEELTPEEFVKLLKEVLDEG